MVAPTMLHEAVAKEGAIVLTFNPEQTGCSMPDASRQRQQAHPIIPKSTRRTAHTQIRSGPVSILLKC